MKVVIVEDEVLSQEHLERLLKRLPFDIEVLAKLDSVKSCREYFDEHEQPDLIFMDIHLGDGNAMDFLRDHPVNTPIIFTTAFDHYAIDAFKVNAVDYLLKPISGKDLENAIQKHHRLSLNQQQELLENIRILTKTSAYKSRFMVKIGDTLSSIKISDIHHFRSEDGMTFLVNRANKRYPLDYNLDQLEQLVDPTQFFRINRKVIVNLESINKVSSFFNSRLKVHAESLPEDDAIVSRERVMHFKEWFNA